MLTSEIVILIDQLFCVKSMKYQSFTSSGWNDIGNRKFEFVVKNSIPLGICAFTFNINNEYGQHNKYCFGISILKYVFICNMYNT